MYNPEIMGYMKTAKYGTWQKLSQAVQVLRHIRATVDSVDYECDFSAKTEGAFFIVAEGTFNKQLLVVFPDDAMGTFDGWQDPETGEYDTPVITALQELVTQNALAHGNYSGLDEFVEFFDQTWDGYSSYLSSAHIIISGYYVDGSNIPDYYNPTHAMDVWLLWVRQLLINAGGAAMTMADAQDEESTRRYAFPVEVTYNGNSAVITVYIAV